MQSNWFLASVAAALVALASGPSVKVVSPMNDKAYELRWAQADSLKNAGMPQSALTVVDAIYAEAARKKQPPTMIRAIIYKMALWSEFEDDHFEKSITLLLAEIKKADMPVFSILHSLQGEMYWRYFEQNRWRVLSRTATSPGSDIKTWDARAILAKASYHYQQSIKDSDELKKAGVADFYEVIEKKEESRRFRPTLFDLLAHRALEFYMQEEPYTLPGVPDFVVDKEFYFSEAPTFANLEITPYNSQTFTYQVIEIMRQLTGFHLNRKDQAPLVDVELKRLQFVWQKSLRYDKDAQYMAALEKLVAKHLKTQVMPDIAFAIAAELERLGNSYEPFSKPEPRLLLTKAREKCETAIQNYPEEPATRNCKILLERLLKSEISIETDYVSVPGRPIKASVVFKNSPAVFLRLIKLNPEQDRQMRESRQQPEEQMNAYLAMPPLRQWEQALPDDGDLQRHRTEISIAAMPVGYFLLMASATPGFEMADERITWNTFWVSAISFVSRDMGDGSIEYRVMDRDSGKPMRNVTAITYTRQYNTSRRTQEQIRDKAFATNRDGYFKIPATGRNERPVNFIVEFKSGKDQLITDNYFYQYQRDEVKTPMRTQTYLFTDRSIYRPGQTVYYKGIMVDSDSETHRVVKNKKTSISLINVNNEKVSEQFHTTNQFGSFSGSFVLPLKGLTGYYQITTPNGAVGITVEEYRLPRFEVVFDTLHESHKLGQLLTVSGEARAYAGNPIGGAEVTYRVTRQARFPFWHFWWRPVFPASPEVEILNGKVQTGPEGKFSITFKAIADPNIPREQQPVFMYSITADVTDIQGETQSRNTIISVGYKALLLSVNIEKELNRDVFSGFVVKATNLNGQPQAVNGEMVIYKLHQPQQVLRNRSWARPDRFVTDEKQHKKQFPNDVFADDKNPENWSVERQVLQSAFHSCIAQPQIPAGFNNWAPGIYRITLQSKDVFGEDVLHTQYFTLFSPGSKQMPVKEIWWMAPIATIGRPGENARILIGSSLNIEVLMEVEHKGKIVETRKICMRNRTQLVEVTIRKEHQGNFRILFSTVALNRAFTEAVTITVPATDKQLNIKLETLRKKLEPGSKEEWNILITDGNEKPAAAEMLAGMYDAALDALMPHAWIMNIPEKRYQWFNWAHSYAFGTRGSRYFPFDTPIGITPYFREYDRLNWFGFNNYFYRGMPEAMGGVAMMRSATTMDNQKSLEKVAVETEVYFVKESISQVPTAPQPTVVEKPALMIRRDFRETAFFFPQLVTDKSGAIKLQFTLPESLTRWKLMGLAHDQDLRIGNLVQEFESSREVMVVPNAPRFFRQGDKTAFQAKVVNTTNEPLNALATLELFDAITLMPVDALYGSDPSPKTVVIPANGAMDVNWALSVPFDGPYALVYRIKAASGNHSDGEESMLPVLTNRQLITESMPLFINAGETRSFTLAKLPETTKPGTTTTNHKLTLEFTTNPVWYAVQALPYLAEPSYRSADALFHRLYANRLASFIVGYNPEIERVFEVWRKTQPDALLSNLEKNQDLKNIVLEETPWLMDARRESENKRKIANMFQRGQIEQELDQTTRDLLQMQLDNGGWPWMPGMPDNQYVTSQIVAGFGRLRSLGAMDFKKQPELSAGLQRAVYYLDERMTGEYKRLNIKEGQKYLHHEAIQYLWARSYFLTDYTLRDTHSRMFDFWVMQAGKYWLEQPIYMQGMIALALHRTGNTTVAQQIMRSLKNKSLFNEEMGMYWRDLRQGYYWHEAPIEAQALFVESFKTIANDEVSVYRMQQWLIKQKQTQAWKTNRATAEAIYAILIQGKQSLAPNQDMIITIGNQTIDPSKDPNLSLEAGTGYFKLAWNRSEITPDMAKIMVTNKGKTIGWGGLYWQYFEQLDRITFHETSLKLSRKLMRESLTPAGPLLEAVTSQTPLKVGDKMVMRIELRVGRDLEFVHMKDLRAPAFEPINQVSQYNYRDGLGYYENPRDAATHFFFQYLPKGTYVFEYPVFVTQPGDFSTGTTSIQCLYAPEFSAHSEGFRVMIKKE